MARFLDRFEVAEELYSIIENARDSLVLISPYFKLNADIKRSLSKHLFNKKLQLDIVYGKNEDDKIKSLSEADYTFLQSFPNVSIRYHKRLHAKIYLNESSCLLTSMNLHDYSMKENIEFGIFTEAKLFQLSGSLDSKAAKFAEYIVDKATIEFEKRVTTKKTLFGLFTHLGESVIETEKKRQGFCLRTGTTIPYNPKRPYSLTAFESWNRYKNPNYKERYCHSCGKPSVTSMLYPLCKTCTG